MRGRRALLGVGLALGSTALTLGALELAFAFGFAESDSSNRTLASRRWFERHWVPINQLGLRDPPLDPTRLDRTRILVVLGDSFAAGHGIEREEQRASGLLRTALGPDWSVVTLARQGWDTRDETQALREFPWRPDVVVLWWFLNDILPAAAAHGLDFEPDLRVHPAWLASLVERSYLANFVYWRLRPERELQTRYAQFLAESFDDPAIWRSHEEELAELVAWVRSRGAQLVAVVFPDLAAVAGTARYAGAAAAFFEARGVPTIAVAKLLRDWPPARLTVNPRDSHPSVAVHAELAERIVALLRAEGWTAPGDAPSSPPRG